METRKVYKSGGSTYVISLPKRWAKKVGIKEGSSVFVKEADGLLTISSGELEKGKTRALIDSQMLNSQEDLKLLLIAQYLTGYDEIVVKFEEKRKLEYKKDIKSVLEFLMGLEIAEEHEDHVLLEVFLDQERTPTPKALKRMYLLIKGMLKDGRQAIKTRNLPLAKDILEREGEVDRLYFLVVRQLKSAVRYSRSAVNQGLEDQRTALGYRIVVKSFERISDHIENLVSNYLEIVDEQLDFERLDMMMDRIIDLFEESSRSIFKKDQQLALKVIHDFSAIKKHYEDTSNVIFSGGLSLPAAIHYKGMLDSLSRIANYSSDIAEIAVNMSVSVP